MERYGSGSQAGTRAGPDMRMMISIHGCSNLVIAVLQQNGACTIRSVGDLGLWLKHVFVDMFYAAFMLFFEFSRVVLSSSSKHVVHVWLVITWLLNMIVLLGPSTGSCRLWQSQSCNSVQLGICTAVPTGTLRIAD